MLVTKLGIVGYRWAMLALKYLLFLSLKSYLSSSQFYFAHILSSETLIQKQQTPVVYEQTRLIFIKITSKWIVLFR